MNSKKLNILIVESSLPIALRLQLQLQKIGHQIIGRTNNSKEALLQISTTPPDLILLDTELSGDGEGLRLAKQIRFLKIPILFTTLYGNDDEFETARRLNMIGYLVKPVEKFSLLSAFHWLDYSYE